MAGNLTVQGQATTVYGAQTVQLTQTYNNPIGAVTNVTLASGDNTITVPSGTTTVIIQLPSANTIATKIKGAAGDTGILLNKQQFHIFQPDSTVTSFILNSASAQASASTITFL